MRFVISPSPWCDLNLLAFSGPPFFLIPTPFSKVERNSTLMQVVVFEGTTVDLRCGNYSGLIWKKDGRVLINNSRYNIKYKSLEITNITLLDSGIYTCHDKNDRGANFSKRLLVGGISYNNVLFLIYVILCINPNICTVYLL